MTAGTSLPGAHNISRTVLENGVTVLIYENFAAQSVVIAGSVQAGSQWETPAQNGLAAMTANALMRGTQTRDFNAIAASLEDIGADLSISAGVHRASFYGKALAEDLNVLIELLADVLRQPTFPETQVERLRGETITSLKIRQQDTRYRASRAFHESLYPADHPYHYSVRGSIETVSALTPADLAAFHRRFYGPRGMILAIVGAVTQAQALAIVRAALADWQQPDQPPPQDLPAVPSVETARRSIVRLAGKTQSDIVMGLPGPSRLSPDFHAAQIANSVLGQFGMMGRIGASVREQAGLAYYAYSQLEAGMGPGPWSVAAGVNPANVENAIEKITQEIHRITQEPISEDDLSDNVSYFVGHLPLQLESNEGIASSILNMEMYDLGLDYLVTYRARLEALTREDILAAARRYLDPERLVIAIAGPNGSGG
ncbi:insulinase family protein [Anaerolineae bacterium CFX9]|nr:insulinase family protein [Anaerolineae bacterium CFX9]